MDGMSDPMKQAWTDVGDGFSVLGRLIKDRYQGAPADESAGASSASGALRDAIDKLVAAGREFGDRATDVARDDDVKEQAKRAADALNDALSATVDMIGKEVGDLFKRPKQDEPSEIAGTEPTSDDARQ